MIPAKDRFFCRFLYNIRQSEIFKSKKNIFRKVHEKNTHFLYHVHPETSKTELDYMVKTFMQEGYTNASIVPGGKFWTSSHKKYLPT